MKKLLALAAVAAMGVSVVGATPQTQFKAGQNQIDAGAFYVQTDGANWQSDRHWNGTAGFTHAFTNRVALQYAYTGLHTTDSIHHDSNSEARMHEVNIIESLNPHVALYQGYANFDGGIFSKNLPVGNANPPRNNERNHVAQFGAILKTNIGPRVEAYAKGALGTKKTSLWEAGLGFKLNKNLDLNVGYKYINTAMNDDKNVSWKGLTTGLTFRFGGHSEAPVAAPVAATPAPVAPAPEVKKADYYTTSIYFDSDIDTPRADQAPHLTAALDAANQYPNDYVKLIGNADSSYTPEYNQGLSERRVQSVAQYLVNNGVNSNRLVGLANGDRKPVADNATPAGRAENRRVDVFVNR